MSCTIWNTLLSRQGHFYIDQNDCKLKRKIWDKMPLQSEMETLATDPVAWHGNGAGKKLYIHLGHMTYKCFLDKQNITIAQYEKAAIVH
jgi:hypothetical protein